jgi:putative ABC transport system substrate-binding protein
MQRRHFMMLLGGTAAAHSLAARAEQPERKRQIGWLVGLREQDPEAQSRNTVIVRALSDLGWIVGRNLHIEYRYLVGDSQRFDSQAAELVALAPDVLIANSTPATRGSSTCTDCIRAST